METVLTTPRLNEFNIAPGFRKHVWQLLLQYFDSCSVSGDGQSWSQCSLPHRSNFIPDDTDSETADLLYAAAYDLEREFIHHGLMERVPIETCGTTVIRLHLDGKDIYVATLSMNWWRFVCQQLTLPFPVVIESF